MYRFSQLVHTMKWSPLLQGLTHIMLSNQGILGNTKRSAPFFNEAQFEAYRTLGYQIADELFADEQTLGEFQQLRTMVRDQ